MVHVDKATGTGPPVVVDKWVAGPGCSAAHSVVKAVFVLGPEQTVVLVVQAQSVAARIGVFVPVQPTDPHTLAVAVFRLKVCPAYISTMWSLRTLLRT